MSVIYLRQGFCIDRSDLDQHLDLSQFESSYGNRGTGSAGASAANPADLFAAAGLLCVPFALVLLVWCLLPQATPGVVELSAVESAIEFWSQ